ncbi:hypothetical protein RQM59_11820 [Flavobacteriaceae bacterium S356]|uniref:TfoX N-terminal domain-containing protein n=1 Tax=Asprobacillus argus TaxID=3076534 RepID=A0ABU3LH70_9FLAO|nr:hypothetical protein [Flavobacteriaceae bacterium S356]
MWEKQLELYDEIASMAGIERKGKTMPYTSSNGYMFSLLNKDSQFGIRLSKEDTKTFLEAYPNCGEFRSHGAKMREYVFIPADLLVSNKKLVTSYLKKGLTYVNTLKPK